MIRKWKWSSLAEYLAETTLIVARTWKPIVLLILLFGPGWIANESDLAALGGKIYTMAPNGVLFDPPNQATRVGVDAPSC